MDRSWMSKDRMSREYEEGVEYFINFALEHCPNQRGIRCPCMRCGNLIHHTPNKIREHMFFNGIDQSYCTWYWHGEAGPTSSQPTEMAQRYDTMDCGDVASTVEMVHAIEDEFMTDPMSFKKLLEDAEKPLGYAPVNNEMPLSMYEAKKTLNALGMEYKKIHACPNDCILYRNELNEASSCPTCGTSRWKVNKAGARNTKRIPAKVLWNLRLAISADGINPHSSMTSRHSCWPVLTITYNLPPWLCMKRKFMMLSLLISGPRQPGKTKDGVKSRLDLLEMGLRPDLAPRFGLKRTYLPPACYTLSRKEKKIVLQTLADLKVPEGYCSNFRNLVSMEELKLNGLKSHDYHALMQQLLPVAIRSVLPKHVRYAITRLCFFFNALCAKVVDVSRLNDIQQDIVVTLCLLEKYFPPSIFDIMLHLTVHLVREVRLCGPVYMRWMYPFERGSLRVLYRVFIGMDAIGIPSSMKDEWKCGKPLLGGRAITIHDYKLVEQAHHYVLQNTTIVQPFIEQNILVNQKRVKWLEDEHVRTFSHWLRKKVSDDISKKEPIEKELKWLAQGPRQQVLTYPGYIIHGCRYHIKNRDEARVNQNSGCDWVDSKNGVKVDELGFTLVDLSKIGHKSDPFILATQAQQVFYVEDQVDPRWSIVLSRPKMELFDIEGDDNIADNCMEHHPFANGMPNIKSFDEVEDYDEICMRTDCEGIWIEN
ncbi:hypothetical protein CK203_055220 [Vitis vinifera]|uniref:Transposase-associated domain-containing protein n=1 Tax=Vitis vinifera TaxID=29760 RepID=A0A438GU06_VITVI|nr:hypothetical protein CK203_055220 [Vitis vinifera]